MTLKRFSFSRFTRNLADMAGWRRAQNPNEEPPTNTQFWCDNNVTHHRRFASTEESLRYLHWRNSQYYNHAELMPVSGQDGKTVLDHGCGPGNDLVGFCTSSRPKRLIGMDISVSSIAEAKDRVALHSGQAETIAVVENDSQIPLGDAEVDYIHSCGVVHHAIDPGKVLREFRRVLKPSGACRVMVYNYDSIWLHFFVAYTKMRCENAFPGLDLRASFSRTCDGGNCPIARVYRPREFIDLAESCGFKCSYLGAAISVFEIAQAPRRFDAIQDIGIPQEHRDFLLALTFDPHGFPMWQGNYAGVNAYFELTHA